MRRNVILAALAVGIVVAASVFWLLTSHTSPLPRPAAAAAPSASAPAGTAPAGTAPAGTAPAGTAPAGVSAVDLLGIASNSLKDCPLSSAPSVPDGATASLAQMTAARSAFEAYDVATDAYTKCVDAAVDGIARKYKGAASADDLAALNMLGLRAHNTAIDQEQAIADQFNSQVRIYKAKHAKS